MTVVVDTARGTTAPPALPQARGPASAAVIDHLGSQRELRMPPLRGINALADDDLHLALYCCYELHYRGFAGVDESLEWSPAIIAARRQLERAFVDAVRGEVGPIPTDVDAVETVRAIVEADDGPSLSAHLESDGTIEQFREFCIHRSAYQLKEADPHTWAIPRLAGEAKAAMVTIQMDEYGNGTASEMHASLFADTLSELGLSATYGAYLDALPGATLATVNLVSLFGLHRRWRGAAVGHLGVFEMTSVTPMGRYSRALARLGYGPRARRFFDVHVAVDAIHATVALDRMVAAFVRDEPDRAADVVFGAKAVTLVERRFSDALLGAWRDGRTSLSEG